MRRPVLLTLAAVGGVIVLLGGTGIFAALTDTARSGTNSIESGALQSSSDLRVAAIENLTCGPFSEDLTSPLFTISGPPGGPSFTYCLRNVGSQTVQLTVAAEELNDVEIDCTGDESIYDATCGSGPGELSDFTLVLHAQVTCELLEIEASELTLLRFTTTAPVSLGSLGPGQTRCFLAAMMGNPTDDQKQPAQSDRLTWRFAWTGQA